MSAEAYKRELVRAWCGSIGAAPFVATINDNEKPPSGAAIWWTVKWSPDLVEPIAFCGVTQETGTLDVVVAGAPNLGDGAVAAALDAIVLELLAKEDPEGLFTLEAAGAPTEDSAGTADRWYRLVVGLDYRLITGGPT